MPQSNNHSPLLEFENVTVMRGSKRALDSLTFSVREGEHVAILGPNGSGKSTLIKAITRECYPIQGSALRILGQDRWNVFDLRVLLGMVSNDLMLTCTREITGREAVLSGFFSSAELCPWHHVTPEMERKADEVLALMEVPHLAQSWMNEMSSGEARRMLIGRALVHDPKALVLDEPTTSLDLRATWEVHEILRKLARGGITIVMVTHHLPDLIPEIGRAILLKNGRVFFDGARAEALSPRMLAGLFEMPEDAFNRG